MSDRRGRIEAHRWLDGSVKRFRGPDDSKRRPSPLRWAAAPAVAALAVAAVAAGPQLAAASPPSLPTTTPEALVAKILSAKPPSALSATVSVTAHLGLSAISSAMSETSGSSGSGDQQSSSTSGLEALVSGTHQVEVWMDGQDARVAIPTTLAESDIISTPRETTIWDSTNQRFLELFTPADRTGQQHTNQMVQAVSPEAEAHRLVASAPPTSRLGVLGETSVAGRAVYRLALIPEQRGTLIGEVVADVAPNGWVLGLQVWPKDGTKPALDLRFASLSIGAPSASVFSQTPPPGAHVRRETLRAPQTSAGSPKATAETPSLIGHDWLKVAVLRGSTSQAVGRSGLGSLAKLGTAVQGTFGTGELFTTPLVDALMLPDGTMLVGMVQPSVLEADAAALGTSGP